MIDVRIVCAYDAVKTAQTLQRLLVAEQHAVEVCYGRGSLAYIEESRARREAVILIWSLDAPSALYMLQWAKSVDPLKLVEVARAPTWPQIEGRRGVIDFSAWSGERGGSAWRTLEDRLRNVQRATEPPRPPPHRAAMALAGAGVLAVGGALIVRVGDASDAPIIAFDDQHYEAQITEVEGQGGPLIAVEPNSMDDETIVHFSRLAPRAALLGPIEEEELIEAQMAAATDFEDARLLDRLSDFARMTRALPGTLRDASLRLVEDNDNDQP